MVDDCPLLTLFEGFAEAFLASETCFFRFPHYNPSSCLPVSRQVRAFRVACPPRGPAQIRFFLPHSMAIKRKSKKALITKHRKHEKDTGSPQVQIALLTKSI